MLTAHIEWFNQMLTTALQLYFQQGCEYSSIEEVTPPDDGWLEEVTGRQDISFSERVVVMLALMPHTSPQSLDIFFVQNKNFDRQYTEFGGWKGLSHGGFLPTGETASFILAGEDMERKKEVIRMFQKELTVAPGRDPVLKFSMRNAALHEGGAVVVVKIKIDLQRVPGNLCPRSRNREGDDCQIRTGPGDFIGGNNPHIPDLDFRNASLRIRISVHDEFDLPERIDRVSEFEIGIQAEDIRLEFPVAQQNPWTGGFDPLFPFFIQQADIEKSIPVFLGSFQQKNQFFLRGGVLAEVGTGNDVISRRGVFERHGKSVLPIARDGAVSVVSVFENRELQDRVLLFRGFCRILRISKKRNTHSDCRQRGKKQFSFHG